MRHRLDPLLRPRRVAVVGASARSDSMGAWAIENLLRGGFSGTLWPVNPRYGELRGLACYPSLGELPGVPELVIFAVGDSRIEALVDEAVSLRVPAVLIMSALALDEDTDPPLRQRIANKLRNAGTLACGANGMGFYNVRDCVWACGFDSRQHEPPGRISLISHSGAGMSGIVDCDERLRINFAVSTGNELSVTMDEYLDFALELPETRVVGLFIETARNPAGLRRALEKANRKRIPVVAVKTGRTGRSAPLSVSHSGALAGNDAAFEALFERYGVQRVRDLSELATALVLFAELGTLEPGGLVALHDSGGERQLLIDLAADAGVALTELAPETQKALKELLPAELPAVNPLDAWSRGGPGAAAIMSRCLAILMRDPGCALGALLHDRAPEGRLYASYLEYLGEARTGSGKPGVLVASHQGTGCDPLVIQATRRGTPVLDGIPVFLRGVRALFDWRDHLALPPASRPDGNTEAAARWRRRLDGAGALDEAESLKLLSEFGLPVNPCRPVTDDATLEAAAAELGYPLVLKTAMPGILHKTERAGVLTGLDSEAALKAGWRELARRLGPRALVSPMVENGVEMFIGARRDPQFGPIVLFGFGGIYAETLDDVVPLLPPADPDRVLRRLEKLRLRPLLEGPRGRPPANVAAFAEFVANFSALAASLAEVLGEIDVNPVTVTPERCLALDALVVGRGRHPGGNS